MKTFNHFAIVMFDKNKITSLHVILLYIDDKSNHPGLLSKFNHIINKWERSVRKSSDTHVQC